MKKTLALMISALVLILVACGSGGSNEKNAPKEEPEKVETSAQEAEKKKEEKTKEDTTEKDYYTSEVLPQIEDIIVVYDGIWNELWVPTFEGIADGSVDTYTAFDNMKELEQRYTALDKQISEIDGAELSKDNKKLLDEFKSELRNSASLRRSSGNEAKKMIDKGTFSPSEVDKVMTTVGYSESPMLNAVTSKTAIESNLGL